MPTKEEIKQLNKTVEEKYGKYSFTPIITSDVYEKLSAIGKNALLNTYSMYSTLQPSISKTIFETANLVEKCRPLFIDAMEKYRPYIIQQTNYFEKLSKSIDLQNLAKCVTKVSDSMVEISSLWTSRYNEMFEKIKEALNSFTISIPSFDFSKIDQAFKDTCLIMLRNGYYPSREMNITICDIRKMKNKKQIIEYISSEIEEIINKDKKMIIKELRKYKTRITEIYRLYEKGKYRLCILSQLNLLSNIYNDSFEHKDFTEISDLTKKMETTGLKKTNESNYSIFSPYLFNKEDNTLLVNYKKHPEKYKKIPYNRNAIHHGYSKRYGTKRNCLRWFSVIINTVNLLELQEKLQKDSTSNQIV